MAEGTVSTEVSEGRRQEELACNGEGQGGDQVMCLDWDIFIPGGSPLPCLDPSLALYHLPGLVRNHGNRKPEEMTEMLGGHPAAWGHPSVFRRTRSFSNKE